MALLPILSFPDPRLRTIAKPVEEVTDEIRADLLTLGWQPVPYDDDGV